MTRNNHGEALPIADRAERAIGIFDSGIGGLTVVREIRTLLPKEDIVYFGDTARIPYGSKSEETIVQFAEQNGYFLRRFKPKVMVVACNTASSVALPYLRRRFSWPVYGVVAPGARQAAAATRNNIVGVLGTRATIASGAYQEALKSCNKKVRVIAHACPCLVSLVEEGRTSEDQLVKLAVKEYVKDLKRERVDTVLLACTHYPVIREAFEGALGRRVTVVDCGSATAAHLADHLGELRLLARRRRRGKMHYFVSDNPRMFATIGSRFMATRVRGVIRVSPEEFFYPHGRRLD